MGKHRHERFQPGFAVMRIDEFHQADTSIEDHVALKEVWWSKEQADTEAERLNTLNADKRCRYLVRLVRVQIPDEA